MELEGIWLKIGTDLSALKTLGSDVENIARVQIGQAMQNLGSMMTDAITRPLMSIASEALKVGSAFEQTGIAFTTMLGSGEKATRFLAELKQFASSTPFEFESLTRAATKMQALGFAADQVIPSLRAIGDASAALGGGAQMIDRVTTALGQMQSKGKVSAQEINQLAEAGIGAWKILSEKMGKSIPEVMALAEKGMVNAARAVPELLNALNEQFGGMMEKQAKTIAGQWSNVKDQVTFILMDLGAALAPAAQMAMDALQPLLGVAKLAVDAFKELSPGMQLAILGFVGLAAAAGPVLAAVGAMAAGFTAISGAVAILTGPAMLAGMVVALKAIAVGAAAVAVAWGAWELGKWLVSLTPVKEALDAIRKKLSEFWDWFSKLPGVSTALKAMGDSWDYVKTKTSSFMDSVQSAGKTVVESASKMSASLGKTTADWLLKGNTAKEAAEKAAKAAAKLAQEIDAGWNKITTMLHGLPKTFSDFEQAMAKGFNANSALKQMEEQIYRLEVGFGMKIPEAIRKGMILHLDLAAKQLREMKGAFDQIQLDAAFEKANAAVASLHQNLQKVGKDGVAYLQGLGLALGAMNDPMTRLLADAKGLGVVLSTDLVKAANQARGEFEGMVLATNLGMTTSVDFQKSLISYLEKQIAANKATGDSWVELQEQLDSAKRTLGTLTGEGEKVGNSMKNAAKGSKESASEMTKAWGDFGKQVSTILTDFGKGIADSIIHAKSFGDAFTKMANALKEAFLRTVVEGAIKEAIKGLDGFTASFSGLMSKMTSGLGSLFGGGGGGAAGAGGGASGGASGGLGGAAGALGGVAGMIGSIGSLISGVIGNFQMSGMNETLDLIEKEVRYSQIHLANLLEFANAWWPTFENLAQLQRLESIERVLYEQKAIMDAGLRVNSQGLGDAQQTTINWLKYIAEGVWATYQAIAKPGWQTTGGPVRFTNPSVPTSGGGDPTGSRPPVTIQVNMTGNSSNPYTQGLQVAQGINALLPARI